MDFHLSDDIDIQEARKRQGPCNPRLDFLSIPGKRRVLALWMDYARSFSPERMRMVKRMLQELYSLSPEDTEAYFEQLRQEAKKQTMRKRLNKKMKKKFIRRLHRDQRGRAYRLFEKLLRRGMCFAFHNCLPPFMSIRLKQISDVILEQLCELREVPVPDRATEDKLGLFLIVVADWFAVALEQIFYMVYIKKNLALEEMQESAKQEKLQRIAREKELASEMLDVDPEAIVDPIAIGDPENVNKKIGKPKAGNKKTRNPNVGNPKAGYSKSGYPNVGNPNAGNSNVRNAKPGDQKTGNKKVKSPSQEAMDLLINYELHTVPK